MSCVRFTPAVCRIAPNRTACDMFRSYSAVGRDRHSCVLAALVRISTLAGSLRVCSFICGDPDGGRGERGWRRSVSALLRNHIGFAMFSAGSTLRLRAPDCAKESKVEAALPPLWTLFTLRRGCLSAYTRRHPGTRKDPPGSDLWPGGSGCIEMIPTRSNVQTRAAPKRRGVGLQRAERCGCRAQPCLETFSMLRRTASSVA